jgi:hypothetical protein
MAGPNQPNRNLIMILGAVVLIAATLFIVTGGGLGTRKVEGDHDLPQVTSPKPSPGSDSNTGRR